MINEGIIIIRVAEGQSGLPGRPARSACQAGHLAWPGRSDPGLTGRQTGYYNKLLIHFAMSIAIYSNYYSYYNQLVMVTIYKLQMQKLSLRYIHVTCSDANSALAI